MLLALVGMEAKMGWEERLHMCLPAGASSRQQIVTVATKQECGSLDPP